MLKKTITFTNYDGEEQSVDAYFNLTRTECMDLNLEYEDEGGLIGKLKKMINEKKTGEHIPQKPAVDFVRLIVERSYGVRPKDDPSLFLKEDENGNPYYRKFRQSLAYHTYVYKLLSGEESLDEFVENVMPKISDAEMAEAREQMKAEGLERVLPEGPHEV